MRHRRRGDVLTRFLRLAATLGIGAAVLPGAAAARNLYVANEGDPQSKGGGIRTMPIGADGSLTATNTFPGGSAGYVGVAMSPDGRHLFAPAWSVSVVSGLSVNADGSLTGDGNSSGGSVNGPFGVSLAPSGRFLYVANRESGTVSAFDVISGIPSFISSYPAGAKSWGVAMTPDGSHVYVANRTASTISGYNVAANGALTHIADFPMPTGPPVAAGPSGIVVSPDGRHLFAANNASGNITSFTIDSTGLLLPVGTFPSTDGALSSLALSPDGRHLFAAQDGGPEVVAFNVAADGSVAQVGASISTKAELNDFPGMAVTPDGRYLYVTSEALSYVGRVAAFAIQPSGALVGVLGSPFPTGLKRPDFQSLVVAPDQSPVASFSAKRRKGTQVAFDGSASSDADGSVTRYDWDFGDGASAPDGGPGPSHTYATPGHYTVTLTVVDNEGCSTRLVYTGQTASCSGSSPATRSIQAGKLAVTLGGAKKQALSKRGIKLRVKCNVDSCRVKASATFKGLKPRTKAASLRIPKAGKAKTLRLALSRHAYEQLKAALADGGGLVAKVKATAKAGGLSASARRSVKLTG